MSAEQSRRRAPAMSPDQRRSAIVQAVLPLLVEHGANITTRQIAQAAGIAEGTVFRAFNDKEELLRACVAEAFRTDQLCAAIRQVPRDGELADRLNEVGTLFLEHFTRLGDLMQTLVTTGYDVRRDRPTDRTPSDARAEFMRNISEAVTDALAPDEPRLQVPVEEFAQMLLALVTGMRFAAKPEEDRSAGIRKRVEVLLHGALAKT
ncbi:TetR/AcrR family transcriptional regulator [Saccharopolyspora sp. K220]|uniref:TetR/AcrR family transcriptional regulator n=1 Tax=Saccharopolyspora soli TaxID=2926618 RepID=UPI001F58D53D|nr:TetR/AcrR family transcriptional regulator [Saccharopolyspora soli]MCI2422441.1 TetR/AcrR family transcriptional regulator [Saccharopolyspora soli]